ncbi:MAG TPA: hypothetical protein RMH85_30935 [Polyangiaceae bacterium LLY-WYZ-15_(1-7)]|nr:hypothetical protein [Sandaracinus sp.]HJL05633.1 hypothetical protein [Polyangiaceae bacterium LLY-WYZ-15_(1-7)]MBJ72692.1 hypothetical protein [Sandaracinus sp.]HJL12940.1 hypothetical protein [Polyangiaceae bacterium LLY-WYZ-15_(1-7)]HJL23902.1 hypothetical protein [Polyangiaceae bacterium LLY-WYZ-15_(1-7)]
MSIVTVLVASLFVGAGVGLAVGGIGWGLALRRKLADTRARARRAWWPVRRVRLPRALVEVPSSNRTYRDAGVELDLRQLPWPAPSSEVALHVGAQTAGVLLAPDSFDGRHFAGRIEARATDDHVEVTLYVWPPAGVPLLAAGFAAGLLTYGLTTAFAPSIGFVALSALLVGALARRFDPFEEWVEAYWAPFAERALPVETSKWFEPGFD